MLIPPTHYTNITRTGSILAGASGTRGTLSVTASEQSFAVAHVGGKCSSVSAHLRNRCTNASPTAHGTGHENSIRVFCSCSFLPFDDPTLSAPQGVISPLLRSAIASPERSFTPFKKRAEHVMEKIFARSADGRRA
jgi:hypothetical protein